MTPTPSPPTSSKSPKSSDAVSDYELPKRLFSVYNKREFLSALMLTNCDPDKEKFVMGRFRAIQKKQEAVKGKLNVHHFLYAFHASELEYFISIIDFINEQANMCQKRVDYVMKMNENQHYANLNHCADELSKNATENRNDNLFSVVMERILHTEDLPDAESVNGIDLKQLYNWMANSMAGYPIDIEDGPTKDFLQNCYSVSEFDGICLLLFVCFTYFVMFAHFCRN